MTQEPWKRAAQLDQLKRLRASDQGGPPSKAQRPHSRSLLRSSLPTLILLLLVAGGLAAAWFTRASWLPRMEETLPEGRVKAAAQELPMPRVEVSRSALEDGLGVGLACGRDYLEFSKAAADWRVPLQLSSRAPGSQRLAAGGVNVVIEGGRVLYYTADVGSIFGAEHWAGWQETLRAAGISPELTYSEVTGEHETPKGELKHELFAGQSVRVPGGWASPVYYLHFKDGRLVKFSIAARIGPAAEPGLQRQGQPPRSKAADGGGSGSPEG